MLEISFTPNEHLIFISDVHLAPNDFNAQKDFLIKLDQLCDQYSIEKIFFLGDIFEWCFSWNILWSKVYAPLVDWLHGLAQKKRELFWIEGNHDLFLSDWEKHFPLLKVSSDFIFLQGTQKILLCHGDLCNQSDTAYLKLRKFLRLELFKIFYNFFPAELSLEKALHIAHKSHQKNWKPWSEAQSKQWKENIQNWYTDFTKRHTPPDFIVMGHFHQMSQSNLVNASPDKANTQVYHLPFFPNSGRFLIFKNGEFFYQ